MKKTTKWIAILSLLTLNNCKEQIKKDTLKITDFRFETIFGMTSKEPKNTYSLLGNGFFRTPKSDNSDSLIIEWIKDHPNAVVVPVSSFGPVEINDPDSKMIYCWVIDHNDTLNNFLIKNGCFPGTTMISPKILDDMEKRKKKLNTNSDEKTDVKGYIDSNSYNRFIEQIKIAEHYAHGNKLGVWKNITDEQ